MNESENSRTHEPNTRELCAELDGFRELMRERGLRYDQSFKESKEAVAAALAAAKEQTTAAFLASEKAIVKAEGAQNAYNASHNDLLRKMDNMIPRPEFDGRFRAVEEKIEDGKKDVASLRESRSQGLGKESQHTAGVSQMQWFITTIIALVGVGIALMVLLFPHPIPGMGR